MQRRPGFLTRYAKHAKISVRAAAGQLQRVGINYHAYFDFADADRRREAWTRADRALAAQGYESEADVDIGTYVGDTVGPLGKAQAHERHFKAKMAELEYEERLGTLIKADDADREWFELARLVRDTMLNIPARIADQLAHETDQRKVQDLLEQEIYQAIESLTEEKPVGGTTHG